MEKKNFAWLLFALVVFLIVLPTAQHVDFVSGGFIRAFTFSWLLGFGVMSLRGFGKFYAVGIAIAFTGIVLSILAANIPSSILHATSLAALWGFLLVTIWCTGSQILTSNEISANRVVGAISLYLMLGILWAVTYATLELLSPGSFAGFSEPRSQGWSSEWIYFSFVTMTTLGYGDLSPLSSIARTLAYMQAVFGQFYIAILVAGLVSAYITSRIRP